MIPFLLKKIVSRFFFPISIVIELIVLGLVLKRWRRHLLIAAAVLLYLFSCGPFSYLLLRPLESLYDPVDAAALNKEARWIVVLSGGSRDHPLLTKEDRLSSESLKRLLEGIRLSRLIPEARLAVSGGNYKGETPEALLMQKLALEHGVARERILVEADSWDTADQASLLKDRLGQAPFYLVTSASHMPRAMRLFTGVGMKPLAAPTDFKAILVGPLTIEDFLPRAYALFQTETAFYEYLGLAWTLISRGSGLEN